MPRLSINLLRWTQKRSEPHRPFQRVGFGSVYRPPRVVRRAEGPPAWLASRQFCLERKAKDEEHFVHFRFCDHILYYIFTSKGKIRFQSLILIKNFCFKSDFL